MASFSCVVSFKKSPSSKMPRIIWTRQSVMHDNYESFIEYVTKNVKEAYPKACDLQFTQPEYKNMITQPLNVHLTSGVRLDTEQLNTLLQIGRISALSFIFNPAYALTYTTNKNAQNGFYWL